jgi:hypothetical protein
VLTLMERGQGVVAFLAFAALNAVLVLAAVSITVRAPGATQPPPQAPGRPPELQPTPLCAHRIPGLLVVSRGCAGSSGF